MLNLYEILEVSENASNEVIEKAYRVLAKRYHPDLQQENQRKIAEEKMKQINEAYEIISDKEKREQYDIKLKKEREEQKRIEEIKIRKEQENIKNVSYTKNDNVTYKRNNNVTYTQNNNYEKLRQEEIQRQKMQEQEYNNIQKMQDEMKRAYEQAYNDYWRSRRI